MTPPSDVRAPADTTPTIKRRGLFAAGAALVAGLIARWTEQAVLAGIDGDVVLGGVNTTRDYTAQFKQPSSAPER
jgi:hypothetical protein